MKMAGNPKQFATGLLATEGVSIAVGQLNHTPAEAREVPIEKLWPCPLNPRKFFSQAALDELAASIQALGVLEPLLVRPSTNGSYEILAGERRYKAAHKVGLKTLPVQIREGVTDEQALDIMLVENHQRVPLTPIEQARTFDTLATKFGRSPKQIAEQQGTNEAFVHRRLTLLKLSDAAQKALDEERLELGAAYALARMGDDKQRAEATKQALSGFGEGRCMSTSDVRRLIANSYSFELANAPWSLKDETLLPSAGSCVACPYRTGNNQTLFGDIKGTNVCTKTSCFAEKKAAWQKRKLAEAKQEGATILTKAEAKEAFNYGHLKYNAPYVEAARDCDKVPYSSKNRSWEKVVAGELTPVLAVDDKGELHTLYHRKEAESLAKKKFTSTATADKSKQEARAKELMQERATKAADIEFLQQVIAAAQSYLWLLPKSLTPEALTMMRLTFMEQIGHIYYDTQKVIAKALGIEKPERPKDKQGFTSPVNWGELIEQHLADKEISLVFAVGCAESAWREKPSLHSGGKQKSPLLQSLGVDYHAIRADELKRLKEAAKPKEKNKNKPDNKQDNKQNKQAADKQTAPVAAPSLTVRPTQEAIQDYLVHRDPKLKNPASHARKHWLKQDLDAEVLAWMASNAKSRQTVPSNDDDFTAERCGECGRIEGAHDRQCSQHPDYAVIPKGKAKRQPAAASVA